MNKNITLRRRRNVNKRKSCLKYLYLNKKKQDVSSHKYEMRVHKKMFFKTKIQRNKYCFINVFSFMLNLNKNVCRMLFENKKFLQSYPY